MMSARNLILNRKPLVDPKRLYSFGLHDLEEDRISLVVSAIDALDMTSEHES